MEQGRKGKKIFLPFAPQDLSELLPLLSGGEVFITEKKDSGAAYDAEASFRCAGRCVTASFDLASIAPAVVECAEVMGGIDRLIFAPELTSNGRLLLDLSYDELTQHTAALNGFFALCTCCLPYMLGREEAEITVLLPREEDNCISRIYRAAVEAAAKSIGEELSGCFVKIRLIDSPRF